MYKYQMYQTNSLRSRCIQVFFTFHRYASIVTHNMAVTQETLTLNFLVMHWIFCFGYINHELDESKTYIVLQNVHVSVISLRINANFKISIFVLDKFSSRLCNYAIDSVLLCNHAIEKEEDKNLEYSTSFQHPHKPTFPRP